MGEKEQRWCKQTLSYLKHYHSQDALFAPEDETYRDVRAGHTDRTHENSFVVIRDVHVQILFTCSFTQNCVTASALQTGNVKRKYASRLTNVPVKTQWKRGVFACTYHDDFPSALGLFLGIKRAMWQSSHRSVKMLNASASAPLSLVATRSDRQSAWPIPGQDMSYVITR